MAMPMDPMDTTITDLEVLEPKSAQVSVILPVGPFTLLQAMAAHLTPRAWLEKSIDTILNQRRDPTYGTADTLSDSIELVVAGAGVSPDLFHHLESIYAEPISLGRLILVAPTQGLTRGEALARGIEKANGAFLCFLDPAWQWRPGYFQRLLPKLSHADLVLAIDSDGVTGSSSNGEGLMPQLPDWKTLWRSDLWVGSGCWIRRSLFNSVGGLPSGLFHHRRARLPGMRAEYELWLKAAAHLLASEKSEKAADRQSRRGQRLLIYSDEDFEKSEADPQLFREIDPILSRLKGLRDIGAMVNAFSRVPSRQWLPVLQLLRERVDEWWKGSSKRRS